MSYDLMVFDPSSAPKERQGFMKWYTDQSQWSEGHSYDNPDVTSTNLREWFMEMIKLYPPLNGPFASDDVDNPRLTDYSIGRDAIYACFAWSEADSAYSTMFSLAQKYRVGFFDVSSDDGGVWATDSNGNFSCLHGKSKSVSSKTTRWKFWKRN